MASNSNFLKTKVSVVMATYNGEKYIKEQLDSICSQLSINDELVICDDCSLDKTVEIVEHYIKSNKLEDVIKLYVNEVNMGFQNNFDKAMNLADGDYIFFSDQDDVWMSDKIEKMLTVMRKYDDCEVLCCDYSPWYMSEGSKAPHNIIKKMPNNMQIEHVILDEQTLYIGQLGCCMCITKEFRDSLVDYWFDGWAQDDRCWRMALCDGGLYIYHENLVKHRIHDKNTATYGKYHTLEKRCKLFENMLLASKKMKSRIGRDCRELDIIIENIKMMELRLKMLKSRNILLSLKLLKYLPNYQKKKSFLIESYMVVRGK